VWTLHDGTNLDIYAISFRLKLNFSDHFAQTTQLVQGSARYHALSAVDKAKTDAAATALCQQLSSAEAALTPTQKAQFVTLYQAGVRGLAHQGWLTQAQATTLIELSRSL